MNTLWLTFLPIILIISSSNAQRSQQRTYCNPINIDYTYMIYNAHRDLSYRSGADPAVVAFRGEYYMFVTRSMGYWHSHDLLNWRFIKPKQWYFEGSNAPAAFNYKDSILYVAGNPSGSMSVLYSHHPADGEWEAVPAILNNLQDPALFIDDDGQGYIFWGSSNKFPIRARTLDVDKNFRPGEEVQELFNLKPEEHGWERFGENHADTVLGGYIEGPWVTKHNDRYYLQYAAPGTEFNVYGDGVYISDKPLGPYEYAPNSPFSYKPGGFINGAGHGSEEPATVYAIQVNFADHQAGLYGKVPGLRHRYLVEGSTDGEHWQVLVDRSNSYEDTPNDYVELSEPKKYQYIRYSNIEVPTPYLAISGFRVFGKGDGRLPQPVKGFTVERKADRRDAIINWEESDSAQGYNVLWGIAPDKLYSSWLLYKEDQLELKSLNVDQTYYFTVEAFNENGVSDRSDIVKSE